MERDKFMSLIKGRCDRSESQIWILYITLVASMAQPLTFIKLPGWYAAREILVHVYFTVERFNQVVYSYLTCDPASGENSSWMTVRLRWCLGQHGTLFSIPVGMGFAPPTRHAVMFFLCMCLNGLTLVLYYLSFELRCLAQHPQGT